MTPACLRVASDVGGTFTDNLAYDEAAKRITVAKVPTTPENRALGTVRGLLRALALQDRSGTRRAFFEATGGASSDWVECLVWQREALLAANEISGPAIVEEVSATTVLYPGDQARVDAFGSLIIEVGR